MVKKYKNIKNTPDPYSYITDSHNAIKEYFKLKQKLCLTDKERKLLKINEWSE